MSWSDPIYIDTKSGCLPTRVRTNVRGVVERVSVTVDEHTDFSSIAKAIQESLQAAGVDLDMLVPRFLGTWEYGADLKEVVVFVEWIYPI